MPQPDRHSLRVALLSYRSKPHCGGQGIYVRHLSRELAALGHRVTVFSGQPYPVLDEGVHLEKIPSLDLYNDAAPFKTPPITQWRDWIDVLEVATMWTAGFPEPLTFSLRVRRELRERRAEFDVVHDNQTLGYGLLGVRDRGFPLVTTIHHPITVDRRIELEQATGWQRISKRRWYSFVGMQGRIARRLRPILVPSHSSAHDIVREFGTPRSALDVVPLGVDPRTYHPHPDVARTPGRLVCVASADSPMKGIATLLRATAKLATERDVSLTIVSKPKPGGPTDRLVDELCLRDRVTFASGMDDAALGRLLAGAEVAVVPSFYEGFSLPAVEAMACGTPLVASYAGALPEVVGDDGDAGLLVPPGDPEELATAIAGLLDDPAERARMGAAAWQRVQERFTWRAVAEATARRYAEAIGQVAASPADRSARL
ncbi:glycosyltransferase involved in cell wall biosynthesis [Lipingzhangella halophila]|uniref:Glycosyltransferase involved in cell wall biosynthesis n=1 Tax=Lipingzhangella halophila TaxID=1783352 RepID=A0A7W7W5E4_9ACTN|nr:glycosyltransferase family 4 protein [Lipingzhangella halophila]MBB4933675.1 glycosyltransferase involved in cell wall biosynthesis [Lipingzhangella halophila]